MKGLPTLFYAIYTKALPHENQVREQKREQNAKREQLYESKLFSTLILFSFMLLVVEQGVTDAPINCFLLLHSRSFFKYRRGINLLC